MIIVHIICSTQDQIQELARERYKQAIIKLQMVGERRFSCHGVCVAAELQQYT